MIFKIQRPMIGADSAATRFDAFVATDELLLHWVLIDPASPQGIELRSLFVGPVQDGIPETLYVEADLAMVESEDGATPQPQLNIKSVVENQPW
jgi:hypothetical protein